MEDKARQFYLVFFSVWDFLERVDVCECFYHRSREVYLSVVVDRVSELYLVYSTIQSLLERCNAVDVCQCLYYSSEKLNVLECYGGRYRKYMVSQLLFYYVSCRVVLYIVNKLCVRCLWLTTEIIALRI